MDLQDGSCDKSQEISPKFQLLSGHTDEKSLAIYRDLALSGVVDEYEEAMRSFPVDEVRLVLFPV
jgi:hypothetical protein